MHLVLNVVAFKVGWVTSVVGAAHALPWAGPVVVAIALAIHLGFAARPGTELALITSCAILGGMFDSALVAVGWVTYPSGMLSPVLAPYWIVGLWVLFATTLNVSFRWLRSRKLLAAAIGAVAGPMSYVAGSQLGAIEFVDPTAALVSLGAAWALLLPLILHIAEVLDGVGGVRGAKPVTG